MPSVHAPLQSFNRGEVSKDALARVDVERLRLSAEQQVNWLPRTLGPMMMRPGTRYLGGIYADAAEKIIPFVFSTTDTALLECTSGIMRVFVNEVPIARVSVATTVADSTFTTGVGWTTTATGNASAGVSSGFLQLAAPALGGVAKGSQTITVGAGDFGKEHAFRIVVDRGPVTFRLGSTSGGDELIRSTVLETGTHSLAFTPTAASAYIEFESRGQAVVRVDSIAIEAAGDMTLPGFWLAADLPLLRWWQSADTVYLACYGYQPRKIERRSARSWSIVLYKSNDGPMQSAPAAATRMWVAGALGNTTLSSDVPYFKTTHVGTLFRLFTSGYNFTYSVTAEDTYTPAVRVSGVGADRALTYDVSGVWTGTLTLQRSFDGEDTGFIDVFNINLNTTGTLSDTLNNSIVWYRIGFKSGAFTSGHADINLLYAGGGDSGICRVTEYSSPTIVAVEVLKRFTSTSKTLDWRQSDWSDDAGWPSAVAIHDGRLFWAGRDRFWGSVSDAFASFSLDFEGDAGPISRSLGSGSVQLINFLLPLTRLIVGGERSEVSIRSSSFDEPLTPTNVTLKDCSTQGSARLPALKVDTKGLFVQKSKRKLFELAFDVNNQDYTARDLNELHPDLNLTDIVALDVQRQPDTRVHCVRADGTVAVLIYGTNESVIAWWRIETDGLVEDVVVLPGGSGEDRVYYVVNRTIGGVTKRFLERCCQISEARGGVTNRISDASLIYSGAATTTLTGLSYLEGKTVVVWGNGKDLGTKVVSGGQITGLSEAVTTATVGLYYEASYKSARLAYGASMGTALTQRKKINRLGVILRNVHYQGLRYGQDFDHMDELPLVEDGVETPADTVWTDYDKPMFTLNGTWDTDSRLCLLARAPRPVTVLAAVVDLATNDVP